MIGTILITLVVFAIIIAIHELGHFIAAKSFGVKVNEFALGMGPAIFKKQKGETLYAVRLFPIGGFVSMEGENEGSTDARAFCNIAAWKRFIVVTAGAFMNVLLGLILLTYLSFAQPLLGTTTIANFDEAAISSVKLQEQDRITQVNGYSVNGYNDLIFQMVRDQDGKIDFEVVREGQKITLTEVPFATIEVAEGLNSIQLDFMFYGVENSFWGALQYAGQWTVSVVKQVWYSLGDLVTGKFGLNQISGPVGTSTVIGEAAAQGNQSLILLIAFITINVGVFNLLPIPALDGGRLLFIVLEMILRRPVSPKYENYIHAAGFVILMGFILIVTLSDILKFFR